MIVPYMSRHVFPLMYIFWLEEELEGNHDDDDTDDGDDTEDENDDDNDDNNIGEEVAERLARAMARMMAQEGQNENINEILGDHDDDDNNDMNNNDNDNDGRIWENEINNEGIHHNNHQNYHNFHQPHFNFNNHRRHNHHNFHNNRQQQQRHPQQPQQRRRLRSIFVTLTSSYNPNSMIDDSDDHNHHNKYKHNNKTIATQERKRLQIQQQLDHLHNKQYSHNQQQHDFPRGKNKHNKHYENMTSFTSTNTTAIASATHRVLNDIPGMLECILTYLPPNDILHCTSYINKRFYHASRNDDVWKLCCVYKWKDKLNTSKVRNWSGSRSYYNRTPRSGSSSRSSVKTTTTTNSNVDMRSKNSTCSASASASASTSTSAKDNVTCTMNTSNIDIALFWRMKVDPNLIIQSNSNNNNNDSTDNNTGNGPSIHEMKLMLMERPLGREKTRTALFSCIEKKDLIQLILDLMPPSLGDDDNADSDHDDDDNDKPNYGNNDDTNRSLNETSTLTQDETNGDDNRYNYKRGQKQDYNSASSSRAINTKKHVLLEGFRHLWFGSYASSIIDSKRSAITIDELVSLNGFSMNFKVVTTTIVSSSSSTTTQTQAQNGHRHHRCHDDIKLHVYGMCYFHEDFTFHVEQEKGMSSGRGEEDGRQRQNLNQNVLSWKWIVDWRVLQIERYPPLHLKRMKNWGWKLENDQVVLLSQ